MSLDASTAAEPSLELPSIGDATVGQPIGYPCAENGPSRQGGWRGGGGLLVGAGIARVFAAAVALVVSVTGCTRGSDEHGRGAAGSTTASSSASQPGGSASQPVPSGVSSALVSSVMAALTSRNPSVVASVLAPGVGAAGGRGSVVLPPGARLRADVAQVVVSGSVAQVPVTVTGVAGHSGRWLVVLARSSSGRWLVVGTRRP